MDLLEAPWEDGPFTPANRLVELLCRMKDLDGHPYRANEFAWENIKDALDDNKAYRVDLELLVMDRQEVFEHKMEKYEEQAQHARRELLRIQTVAEAAASRAEPYTKFLEDVEEKGAIPIYDEGLGGYKMVWKDFTELFLPGAIPVESYRTKESIEADFHSTGKSVAHPLRQSC